MHELSVVASLFEILEENVREQRGKRITLVKLQIGALSGIVPELLATAFDIYKKDTIAAEAELEINIVPLKVRCEDCQKVMTKDDFVFICDHCSSTNIKTLAGTEMILEKMDIEV
ncbi:MAG: hydrogenase maturation nickel metallochaperone HypA [Candidatus Aminicenantes bacterium]|jgi:hydrogenase nickel incorporation protein HypA/HybF